MFVFVLVFVCVCVNWVLSNKRMAIHARMFPMIVHLTPVRNEKAFS